MHKNDPFHLFVGDLVIDIQKKFLPMVDEREKEVAMYMINAFLLKDAMMSHNADYTNSIEDIFSALDYDVVEVMLINAEK